MRANTDRMGYFEQVGFEGRDRLVRHLELKFDVSGGLLLNWCCALRSLETGVSLEFHFLGSDTILLYQCGLRHLQDLV